MRILAIGVAGLCLLVPIAAHAEPTADELRATGEQLAKDGHYSEAIAAFKSSNKLRLRATNYCLIGLAYTRRELWSQAEIMISQCKKYATPQDPLPEWMPVLEQTLAERLASVDVAAVDLVVEPAGAQVKLAVSSFAPDELFEPQTIHLPPGRHIVVATAKGYNDAQHTIEVADKTPQHVVITMLPQETVKPVLVHQAPAASPSKVPYVVIGGGAALVVAGAIVHATLFRTAASHLQTAHDTMDPVLYDQWSSKFDSRRTTTIALYGAGALTIGIGVLLELTVFKHASSEVQVSAAPAHGGGMVTVGWTR